jgi:hypothetical protein
MEEKKARRDTTADTSKGTPSVNVRNETPLADASLSPDSAEESSGISGTLFQTGERDIAGEESRFDAPKSPLYKMKPESTADEAVERSDGPEARTGSDHNAVEAERQGIINDPTLSMEDKAESVFDAAGKAGAVAGNTDNEGMNKLLKELENLAVPMEYAEFSRETYNRLFPFGRVKSPIETVKLGANQFEKLKDRVREKYLVAMRQTLTDPVAVFEETRDGRKAHLYIKSFKDTNNKSDFVMSVVVGIGEENVAISTGPRKRPQIIKIMAGSPLIYRGGGSPTDGTGGGNPSPLPVNSLSPDSAEESSGISGTLFQTADPDAEPLEYLRGLTDEIPDAADKTRELAELEKQHPPETNKYLSPNGRRSKLNRAQWYAVRTPDFKGYFGDWERLAVKEFLEGEPIADVKAFPIIKGKPIDTADDWIAKNPIGTVLTKIGEVVVEPDDIHVSMNHTKYANKVFMLPAIKPVLENGAYLGMLDDFYGLPEENHYFAAPIALDGDRKIVFVRVKQKSGGDKRLHIHEVFTEDEIKNAAPLDAEIKKRFPVVPNMQTALTGNHKDRKQSDLYRSIINDWLSVKPSDVSAVRDAETGEPMPVYHGGMFTDDDIPKAGMHFAKKRLNRSILKWQILTAVQAIIWWRQGIITSVAV